jgi:uncharacterized protein (TIGR02757 family)
MASLNQLQELLDQKVAEYNRPQFIEDDPISLPHQFSKLQDIEIIGFWVAMLAWGRRPQIIKSGLKLLELMDHAPYDFMINHQEVDRKAFLKFKHRTFQPDDALYFLEWFQQYYQQHHSLQEAFARHLQPNDEHIGPALIGFHKDFFALPVALQRTRKHVSTPQRKSSCKRLNMFLRWMVRQDDKGVDFGLWKKIRPSQLLIPLDVHVDRIAKKLGLLKRKQTDWQAVLELTKNLRKFDAEDPVKYDYALFGIGVLDEDIII